MRFQNIEDALAFYKRYANCVGFSVRKSPTTKNKLGKIWKVFVYSKQGYREPRKTPLQSVVALANVISRPRENVEERRVKWRRVKTREGCNARMVVSCTNDGQFESLKEIPACFKVDRWTKLAAKKPIFELDTITSTSYAQVGQQNRMISDAWSRLYKCMDLAGRDVDKYNALCSAIGTTPSLASDVPTPFYPPFLQKLAIEILDELVEPGLHKMDMRNKDEACIEVCPKNPTNLNVDNVLVAKLAGKGVHNSSVVRGMGATKGSSLANATCQDVWTEYYDMGIPGIKVVADYRVYTGGSILDLLHFVAPKMMKRGDAHYSYGIADDLVSFFPKIRASITYLMESGRKNESR
ncbi:hypothetical protein Cgig2_030042 [Carnegiea gigantea]|uniref:FAR1 domain-containing protein n=1 Tax=Carnegiea gigantea TaxID=171969 RepID=A0A9Q1K2N3_9CARY|nr:hypothetical protein Cgig2_030042 [Carnegiea gigantea]